MADRNPLTRAGLQLLAGLAVSILLLGSLYLLARATRAGLDSPWLSLLLLANLAAAVILVVVVLIQALRLYRQWRDRELGSRLTTRLATAFILLTLAPVAIVYYFSLGFLEASLDSAIDRRIEAALDQALGQSRAVLQDHLRRARERLDDIRAHLDAAAPHEQAARLGLLARRHGLEEITLYTSDGRIVANHSDATDRLLGPRPPRHQWLQAQQGIPVIGLDHGPPLRIHLLAPLKDTGAGRRYLQAVLPIPAQLGELAATVERAYTHYHERRFLQRPLKYGFFLILTLVVIQSVLLASWAALILARRLMEPLRLLALGTRAVAAGDYHHTLPDVRDDELGGLLRSFNDMTRRLARARDETERHRQALERQKAYLETLLGHLGSGVLSLDRRGRLRTCNRAAGALLGRDLNPYLGRPLSALVRERPALAPLHRALVRHRHRRHGWEVELDLEGRTLLCRAAPLPGDERGGGGTVVVIDDISAMVEAQRHAARTEVAQRLAHEIKNPLTPIQLAAERLQRRLHGTLPEAQEAILERATHTIVAQVQHLKALVGAFSEFAREPRLEKTPVALDRLIEEVAELYRGDDPALALELDLDAPRPLHADPGRLRQLLHNLLKNAREAAQSAAAPRIRIRTRLAGTTLTLCVEDNGPGIDPALLERIFDPYLTTKPRGSGLGLAICKRIVEEHGGRIHAANREDGGARICVELPAADGAPSAREARG